MLAIVFNSKKSGFSAAMEGVFESKKSLKNAECGFIRQDSKKSGFSNGGGKLSTVKKVVC